MAWGLGAAIPDSVLTPLAATYTGEGSWATAASACVKRQ